jgi:inosine-uridine nucleoside N-ribohydrolase
MLIARRECGNHMQSIFPDNRKKIIIDCDVGVDDALALIMAFHSPELLVEAVTGVHGNVPLDFVWTNIQKILALIQPAAHPPIARGADRPLKGKSLYAHSVHGEDGIGGAKISLKEGEKWWEVSAAPAHTVITQLARKHPGEIILIAVGPLTNLAWGFTKDPQGMNKLKEIVIMGGAVREKGNMTPHAEFNFFSDPLAAQMVIESGMPITLVPLDATHQVSLTPRIIEEKIRPLDNRFSRFVLKACQYDPAQHQFRRGVKGVYLHDPLAVGTVVDPSLARVEKLPLRVEAAEGDFFGKVFEGIPGGSMVDVCLGVETERFLDLFISRLKG